MSSLEEGNNSFSRSRDSFGLLGFVLTVSLAVLDMSDVHNQKRNVQNISLNEKKSFLCKVDVKRGRRSGSVKCFGLRTRKGRMFCSGLILVSFTEFKVVSLQMFSLVFLLTNFEVSDFCKLQKIAI